MEYRIIKNNQKYFSDRPQQNLPKKLFSQIDKKIIGYIIFGLFLDYFAGLSDILFLKYGIIIC